MFDDMLRNSTKDMYYGFPIDVYKNEESYICQAELPGVAKEDIEVTFEDGILTILARKKRENHNKYLIHERNFMKLKRELNFGNLDSDTLTAKLENGILTITIKPKEAKPKKMIEIE